MYRISGIEYKFLSSYLSNRKQYVMFNNKNSELLKCAQVCHKARICVLYCIVMYCIVLHCIALHCIALHCIALHCIVYEALYWRPIRPLSCRHSSGESEICTQPWLSEGSLTCNPYHHTHLLNTHRRNSITSVLVTIS